MNAYIMPPKRINPLLRLAIAFAERKTGKEMLVARLLSWYPKAAIGAGVLESLVAHKDKTITERLPKLVRMQVSFNASCPFCIDMNASDYTSLGISREELEGLQGLRNLDVIASFTGRERLALEYAAALTRTPISVSEELISGMKSAFTEREIVIIVSTVAQVNFWTRMVQGFGVPPTGFSLSCPELNLERYQSVYCPFRVTDQGR